MPLVVVRYRESRGEDRTVVSTPFETVAEARAEAARKTLARHQHHSPSLRSSNQLRRVPFRTQRTKMGSLPQVGSLTMNGR